MVNTMTGRCLVRQTAFRPERLGPTRSQVAAALFRPQRERPTRRFRSTIAPGQTSSRRICGLRRRLVLGNRPEERLRDRVRADRGGQVGPEDQADRAAVEVVPAAVVVDVAVPVVADQWVVLAGAVVPENGTTLPSVSRY